MPGHENYINCGLSSFSPAANRFIFVLEISQQQQGASSSSDSESSDEASNSCAAITPAGGDEMKIAYDVTAVGGKYAEDTSATVTCDKSTGYYYADGGSEKSYNCVGGQWQPDDIKQCIIS